MSWTDKKALETFKQLRDEFQINYFIETGTFKGINSLVHSDNFPVVFTCEINDEYLKIAEKKLANKYNVYMFKMTSPEFLKQFCTKYKNIDSKEIIFFYLDAHFYDPNLPIEKRFVVLDELKAMVDMKNCIIAIHDFDNKELGHITYDGIPLDFNLLKEDLSRVNPNFLFYTNRKEDCDIYNEETITELINDPDALDNIKYANTNDEKRYRGILYCVPKELDLTKYNLRKL